MFHLKRFNTSQRGSSLQLNARLWLSALLWLSLAMHASAQNSSTPSAYSTHTTHTTIEHITQEQHCTVMGRTIAIAMQYLLALHVTFQAVEGTKPNVTEVSEHVADAVRKEGQVSA